MRTSEKHILVLSSWYPSRKNPYLGNFVQRQAQLVSESIPVTVVHVIPDHSINSVEIETNKTANLTEHIGYYPDHKWRLIRFFRERALFKKLLQQIDKPTLIHAHVCLPKGYLFLRAKNFFKRPLIITEHGSYFQPTKQSTWGLSMRLLMRKLIAHSDQFIAVSDVLRDDMKRIITSKEIQVIPNPVNTQLFVPTNEFNASIHFLHVSTLDDRIKNITGILEAFDQFSSKGHSTAQLTIVSDEPFEHWQRLCTYKYPNSTIRFVGPLTEEEIVPYFQSCSAFIMNSHYETFSIVLAEAFSCGKPVISTPVGIAKNLPSEFGLQIEIDNVASLVSAMDKFVLMKDQFDPIAIRANALQYDSAYVGNQLNELYGRFSK
jgi:glycosyltransferase involved in cell wall biosynthesis